MASKILIKGGRVVDPANNRDGFFDVLVEKGKVAAVKKEIKVKGAQVIEAQGKVVTPGLIDMHVHLREPGREDEETIYSGTQAAAKGGFTTLVSMPNTEPPADQAAVVEMILEKAETEGLVEVFPVAAVTKELKGEKLSEMADLRKAGAIAFSDDGNSIMNAELARRALEYTKMFEVPLISHSEDKNLSARGQMNEGFYSTLLGLKGIPQAAEEVMVARDLVLAAETQGKLHLAHLSTAGSLDLVRQAKKKGIRVTCEVTPHHLILTEESLADFDTNLKVNPPLRSKEDRLALREGLADGTIDVIASDHAPHASFEKEREFDQAPFGMIGLETTLSLILSELVEKKVLSLSEVLTKMSLNPAKILNLPLGTLTIGAKANITIFDPKAQVKVDVNTFSSKSKNSPFNGWSLKGKVSHLLVGGRLVVDEGRLTKGIAD